MIGAVLEVLVDEDTGQRVVSLHDYEMEELVRQSEGLYDEHVWAWAEHMSEHDENVY